MADFYTIRKRRDDFFNLSFDEMVEKIIDLEVELETACDEIADLNKQIEEA
jgi:hypothetical protein